MIKAIMLIFSPASVWDRIALDKDNYRKLLFVFLIPLIAITVAIQISGMLYLGRHYTDPNKIHLNANDAWIKGAEQAGIEFIVVLLAAQCIKSVAKTFHSRNSFEQGFCVAAHALAPYFFIGMLDAIPWMSPWATFGIGIALTLAALYHGVPRVLEPDPPSAFGIYISSAILVFGITAISRLIIYVVIGGKLHYASLP